MDWGLTGIVLAVIFFITTLFLMLKYHRVKKLVWSYRKNKVIGLGSNTPPELQLLFGEKRVNEVYQTNIIVYNAGNESIRKNDLTEDVRVRFRGAEILRPPTIKAQSKKAIQFSTRAVKEGDYLNIILEFLYLDHNDGAVVEILHTQSEDVSCSGNIIGIKKITCIGGFRPSPPSFWKSFMWKDYIAPLIGLLLFGLVLLISYLVRHEPIGVTFEEYKLLFYLFGGMILGALMGWLLSHPIFSKFPRWSIIKDE